MTVIECGVIQKKNIMKKGEIMTGKLICCASCGYKFFLSEENEKWYEEQGYPAPKRCPKCRKERRENNKYEK